jgi:DNA excision repair protein ERCC-2
MLVGLCSVIPDGVVAFFTSYSYMESLISEWDAMGILRELTKSKLVFIETKVCRDKGGSLSLMRSQLHTGRGRDDSGS